MKLSLLQWSVLANLVLLVATVTLGWQLAQAKPECKAKQAESVIAANDQQRKQDDKRDGKLGAITADSKAETSKALAKAEGNTNARADAIAAVRPDDGCRAPVGLPSLRGAVDEANAAGDF